MSRFNPDDPQLTAYVLGELSNAEAAEVEKLLHESPEAREAVEEIRAITGTLQEHLPAEPLPSLQPAQREAVLQQSSAAPSDDQSASSRRSAGAGMAAVACLMIVVAAAVLIFSQRQTASPRLTEDDQKKSSESVADASRTPGKSYASMNVAELRSELSRVKRESAEKLRHADPNVFADAKLSENRLRVELNKRLQNEKLAQQASGLNQMPFKRGRSVSPGSSGAGRKLPNSVVTNPTPANIRLWYRQQAAVAGRGVRNLAQQGPATSFSVMPGYSNGRYGQTPSASTAISRTDYYFLNTPRLVTGGFSRVPSSAQHWGTRPLSGLSKLTLARNANGVVDFDRSVKFSDSRVLGGKNPKQLDGLVRNQFLFEKLRAVPHESQKGDGATPAPDSKVVLPEPTFDAKDVKAIRTNLESQFAGLAKANPQKALGIIRVKDRLSTQLAAVERQVAAIEQAGKKVTIGEGLAVVEKVVQVELEGLDLDGDGHGDFSREAYDTIIENAFRVPLSDPLSTFSIDVDTASFSNVRRFLAHGQLPPRNAVRVEEMLNYFRYDYDRPKGDEPFSVNLEVGPCPWNTKHRLLRIGLQGREIPHDKRPPSNLVFLIDVSGSMSSAKKLPLVKTALEMLVQQMTAKDRIAIVTYSDKARLVLDPTTGDQKDRITTAIHTLVAKGSTNGSAGIQMAYEQAKKHLLKKDGGANRVILCTDGDLNVGVSSDNELVKLIEKKREESRVFLSVFGFGTGNLKASKLEKLANKGNGHYAYIDGPEEAKKVFVEEMAGMLYTIAKDVKIQVEFNPTQVGSYRLIGYENRMLAAQDFNNDKKDAGEIGAGHTVTALYEIIPADQTGKKAPVDDLKYQKRVAPSKDKPQTQELLTVKLRYKQPNGDTSVKREFPLHDRSDKKAVPSLDFEWASAVALYGMLLRDSKYVGTGNLDLVRELAAASRGADPNGHRKQFLKMVYHSRALIARKLGQPIPAPRGFEAGPLHEK